MRSDLVHSSRLQLHVDLMQRLMEAIPQLSQIMTQLAVFQNQITSHVQEQPLIFFWERVKAFTTKI